MDPHSPVPRDKAIQMVPLTPMRGTAFEAAKAPFAGLKPTSEDSSQAKQTAPQSTKERIVRAMENFKTKYKEADKLSKAWMVLATLAAGVSVVCFIAALVVAPWALFIPLMVLFVIFGLAALTLQNRVEQNDREAGNSLLAARAQLQHLNNDDWVECERIIKEAQREVGQLKFRWPTKAVGIEMQELPRLLLSN